MRPKSRTQRPLYDPRLLSRPTKPEHWLVIDPGTNDVGYAVGEVNKKVSLNQAGHIFADSNNWIERTLSISDIIANEVVTEHRISKILLEMPEQYSSSSVKGSGASNSQSIVKLSGSAMSLVYAAWQSASVLWGEPTVYAIHPKSWKGQAPKQVTHKRLERAWGRAPRNHNASDAMAMFDWLVRKHYRIKPDLFSIDGDISVSHRVELSD